MTSLLFYQNHEASQFWHIMSTIKNRIWADPVKDFATLALDIDLSNSAHGPDATSLPIMRVLAIILLHAHTHTNTHLIISQKTDVHAGILEIGI